MFKRIMNKLNGKREGISADKQVTADHWSENMAGSDAFSADVYWLAVPTVQRRHQHKATAGSGEAHAPSISRLAMMQITSVSTPTAAARPKL